MRLGLRLIAYSLFTSLPLITIGTFLSLPTFTSSVPQSVVIPGNFANNCIALTVPLRRESVINIVSFDAFLLTISATTTTSFSSFSKEKFAEGVLVESDTDTTFPFTCAKQVKGNKNNINTSFEPILILLKF